MKTLLLTLVLMTTTAMAATTRNPQRYAEEATARYAQENSDTSPYGFDGCDSADTEFGGIDINCFGHKTVLVHGGFESTVDFQCFFNFLEKDGEFAVLAEDCEQQ